MASRVLRMTGTNFNPRSRKGSDGSSAPCLLHLSRFQSTLPRRERLADAFTVNIFNLISINAPAKGATIPAFSGALGAVSFQSTLPRRERLAIRQHFLSNFNFNPRSREGSDKDTKMPLEGATFISIHAPAKGATPGAAAAQPLAAILIHAPAKGATLHAGFHGRSQIISIHAPAKGATVEDYYKVVVTVFQSTLPRRERLPQGRTQDGNAAHFNPRSREGSDLL